jgi:hypothetical protein
MATEFINKRGDLVRAAKEPVGLLLGHRAQADERLVDELDPLVPFRVENRLEQLLRLLRIAERIADALVLLGKGGKGARPGTFGGESRNEEKRLWRAGGRARDREFDLRCDPS